MKLDVVFLPELLKRGLSGTTAVVFDVLRATTSITAALDVGVKEIRIFPGVQEAREAASKEKEKVLLSGEVKTVMPPGFDLGNSPGQFGKEHAGKRVFLATTNGTKALTAAATAGAARIFAGCLLNASAAANAAAAGGMDIVCICSGTNGAVSMEDIIGAGAVCAAIPGAECTDAANMAMRLFASVRGDFPGVLRTCQGGKNIIAAKLTPDIDMAARLDVTATVGILDAAEMTIRRMAD